MSNIIPVITLWQPWATWVIKGYKTIETRTHIRFKGLEGKTIGIHAGQAVDQSDHVIQNPYLAKSILIDSMVLPAGVLLGTAKVNEFRELNYTHEHAALIECEKVTRYGLFLSDIKEFERYPKVKGGMGIWYFDLDKMEKVKKPISK